MNIAEQLTRIAESERKIYNEGYTKADNENPLYYIKAMDFRFSSRAFSTEKSNIVCRVLDCTNWNMAFGQLSGIKTLKIICDTQGLSVIFQALVRESADIELLDLTEFICYPTTIAYFAYQAPKLKTILGALDLTQCTAVTSAFAGATALEDVEFVPNTIKITMSFKDNKKLTKASIESIINGLETDLNYDSENMIPSREATSITFSLAAVNKAYETSEGANDGADSDEWMVAILFQQWHDNWTISLV